MAASPENFTLDSGHYKNMPLNAELLEHFTQFARAVQKHDGTPAFSEQTLVELSKAVRGESLVKPQVFAFTPAASSTPGSSESSGEGTATSTACNSELSAAGVNAKTCG